MQQTAKTQELLPSSSDHSQCPKYAPGMGIRLRASPDDDYSTRKQGLLIQGRIQRFKACINAQITDLGEF